MSYIHPAWIEYQRKRFARPDMKLWVRQDAARYCRPPLYATAKSAGMRNGALDCERQATHREVNADDAVELRQLRFGLLALRGELLAFRFQRLLRKALNPGGGLGASAGLLHYLTQPRVPPGNPDGGRWTRVAGGFAGRVRGGLGESFPGSTPGQQARLEGAITRTERALDQIRKYEPEWKPSAPSLRATGSIDGAIAEADARALEAEMRLTQLRSGIGGNFGPPLDQLPPLSAASRTFDAEGWIGVYRAANNMPDLFGRPTWFNNKGVVAVSRMDGTVLFGTNSDAPSYRSDDYASAASMRSTLIERYPEVMDGQYPGRIPNNALFHAESTILLRAAKNSGGSLAGRSIDVSIDGEVCPESCQKVLPLLGLALGNPTVTFTNRNGLKNTMWGGQWLGSFKR